MAEPKLEIERRMDKLESAVLMLAQKLGVEDEVEESLDTTMSSETPESLSASDINE